MGESKSYRMGCGLTEGLRRRESELQDGVWVDRGMKEGRELQDGVWADRGMKEKRVRVTGVRVTGWGVG